MTGPHAICPVTDLPQVRCLHCQGGPVHLFGQYRCDGCGDLLDRGTIAHQTPAPDTTILCQACADERNP